MPALDSFHTKQAAFEGLHTPEWHYYVENFTSSIRGEVAGTLGIPGYTESAADLTSRLVHTVNNADIFYVAPLMNRLVTAAAETWPEDEVVRADDWPTPWGWLYIPGGLTLIDVRGRVITTSAFSWQVTGGRVLLTLWCDKRADPPHVREMPGYENLPTWTPWHIQQLTLGQPLPKILSMGTVLPPEVSDAVVWTHLEGDSYQAFIPEGWSPEQLQPGLKLDGNVAWLISMLRIMRQPLADVTEHGLPANVRRGLAKRRVRVRKTHITVIDFRRRAGEYESHGEREYSHRFFRRGHWRRQWYGSEEHDDRRQEVIYIHPTIVGDESLPLLMREHVNALRR